MIGLTLRMRLQLQEKTIVQGAMGQTVVWKPVGNYYARIMPVSTEARARFQQLDTVVTNRILLRGEVSIDLGDHRVVYGSHTYLPRATAKQQDGTTEVFVEEVL